MLNNKKAFWLLLIGMILVAFNMRASLLALGPLVNQIQPELNLSSSAISLVTTIPVICFGFFALLAPRLAQRFGLEKTVLLCLIIILIGSLVRGLGSFSWLLIGALLLGMSIAIINVLMPGLVKNSFPEKIGLATGCYMLAAGLGATIATAIAVPLAAMTDYNWKLPLTIWAIPALLAIIFWLPLLKLKSNTQAGEPTDNSLPPLWKNKLAWQITIFLGMQSLSYYTLASWFPKILIDAGLSELSAGNYLGLMNLVNIFFCLFIPMIATQTRWQALIVLGSALTLILGSIGLMLKPSEGVVLWAVLLGCGQGASISFILTWIALSSPNTQRVAQLSGMAQTGGYYLAATGPILVGALKDSTGSWLIPLGLLATMGFIQLLAGFGILNKNLGKGQTLL